MSDIEEAAEDYCRRYSEWVTSPETKEWKMNEKEFFGTCIDRGLSISFANCVLHMIDLYGTPASASPDAPPRVMKFPPDDIVHEVIDHAYKINELLKNVHKHT